MKKPREARVIQTQKKKQPNLRGIRVEEREMANSIEMASIDDQNPLISQTEKDEIEEGSKVDHSINIKQKIIRSQGIIVRPRITNCAARRMAPISRIPQTEKDEIKEGSRGDHSININKLIEKKLKDLGNSSIKSRTIFKVNVWLRESNPDAYRPKIVSIGPYHKKDVQLHPMEKYKLLYLRRFLGRKEELDVESCIKELEGLKEQALKCYDDAETSEFCQMLLLDGCFVVEFIREYYGKYPKKEGKILNSNAFIMRDLILLENQLPFFVLDKLHDMTKEDDELPLAKLVCVNWLTFFLDLPKMTTETIVEITGGNIKHLLHLQHAISCHVETPESLIEAGGCYNIKNILHFVCRHLCHAGNGFCKALSKLRPMVTSNATEAGNGKDDQTWLVVMQNATELSEAGVSFAKASFKTSVFDSIKFENGLMTIPRFRVEDITEILLRNLIAYEQQSVDVQPKHFSSFAIFMNNLIESDKDVALLRRKKIIAMKMGADKQVANLFNKIASDVTVSLDIYCHKEFGKAVEYCENHRMRAVFVHYFLKNALTKASIVVAFIALIFTCIQTFLSFTGPLRK